MKLQTITFCSCVHELQDRKYGKNMRAHVRTKQKEPKNGMWRCTVCGKEK